AGPENRQPRQGQEQADLRRGRCSGTHAPRHRARRSTPLARPRQGGPGHAGGAAGEREVEQATALMVRETASFLAVFFCWRLLARNSSIKKAEARRIMFETFKKLQYGARVLLSRGGGQPETITVAGKATVIKHAGEGPPFVYLHSTLDESFTWFPFYQAW